MILAAQVAIVASTGCGPRSAPSRGPVQPAPKVREAALAPLELGFASPRVARIPLAPGRQVLLALEPRRVEVRLPGLGAAPRSAVVEAWLRPGGTASRPAKAIAPAWLPIADAVGADPQTLELQIAVDGEPHPAATGALAVAATAALVGAELRPGVVILGGLSSDGSFAPVDDLEALARAATAGGARELGVPAAQLGAGAAARLGERLKVEVTPVAALGDGLALATGHRLPEPAVAALPAVPAEIGARVASAIESWRAELATALPEIVIAAEGAGVAEAARQAGERALDLLRDAEAARQRGDELATLWLLGEARRAAATAEALELPADAGAASVAPPAASPTPGAAASPAASPAAGAEASPAAKTAVPGTVAEALAATTPSSFDAQDSTAARELWDELYRDAELAAAKGSPAEEAPFDLPAARLRDHAAAVRAVARVVEADTANADSPNADSPNAADSPLADVAAAHLELAAAVNAPLGVPSSGEALRVARDRAHVLAAAAAIALGHASGATTLRLHLAAELSRVDPAAAIAIYRRASVGAALAVTQIRLRASAAPSPEGPPSPSAPPARR